MKPRPWSLLLGLAALAAPTGASAQDAEVGRILERHAQLRPNAEELAMYRLDWAPSLAEALTRAKAEARPILLVVIHAQYGDLCSGHC